VAEEFSQRMNLAPDYSPDLPQGDWYAKGGWVDQGVIQDIHKDMAEHFPRAPRPEFPGIEQRSFLGYAFLTSKIKFSIPYDECERPAVFTDNQGKTTQIPAFGFNGTARRYSKQIKRLYCENMAQNKAMWGFFHYALDLCADDPVYQVVVAVIPAKATLEETLKYLEEKISIPSEFESKIDGNDTLQAPELAFHITHNFTEITGHSFENESMRKSPIDDACLDILFRLDRSGVELIAQAKSYYRCMPVDYKFLQPFLVYLKKRGATRPYFVMWVDNDELLRK